MLNLRSNHFLVQKVLVSGLVYLCYMLAARFSLPQNYGHYLFVIFIVKAMQLVNLGAVSGFLYSRYVCNDSALCENSFFFMYWIVLLTAGFIIAVLASMCSSLFVMWASIFFLCLSHLFAIEPVARVNRAFYVSFLPDLILALSLISSVLIVNFVSYENNDLYKIWLFILLFSCITLSVRCFSSVKLTFQDFKELSKDNWLEYFSIVKVGFLNYIATAGFMLLMLIDRLFITHFFSKEFLGVFMLAFQFVVGGGLVITSLSFVRTIEIGEKINRGSFSLHWLNRSFRKTSQLGFALGCIVIVSSYFLNTFFLQRYHHLTLVTVILVIGYFTFYVVGSFTPGLFYLKKQKALIKYIYSLVFFQIILNFLVCFFDEKPIFIVVSSSLVMLIYSVGAFFILKKVLLQSSNDVMELSRSAASEQ